MRTLRHGIPLNPPAKCTQLAREEEPGFTFTEHQGHEEEMSGVPGAETPCKNALSPSSHGGRGDGRLMLESPNRPCILRSTSYKESKGTFQKKKGGEASSLSLKRSAALTFA